MGSKVFKKINYPTRAELDLSIHTSILLILSPFFARERLRLFILSRKKKKKDHPSRENRNTKEQPTSV